MLSLITTLDWHQAVLVYGYLVLCAFALSAVLKTDIAIVTAKIDRNAINTASKTISMLLLALWTSAVAIIYIDTGFTLETLPTRSKLLLKLVCVTTLTLNGLVLHHLSLPVLTRDPAGITVKESVLLVTTGAISTCHWMLAAFVGISNEPGQLPFKTLISG